MMRTVWPHILSRLALLSLLVLLAAVLSGCGLAKTPHAENSASLAVYPAIGYWRATQPNWRGTGLIQIRYTRKSFILQAAPVLSGRLIVEGNRLVLPFFENGKATGSGWEFQLTRGGNVLLWSAYGSSPVWVTTFKRAAGSATVLAKELHGWATGQTINSEVSTLAEALDTWKSEYGRFPSRTGLLRGGSFWRWPLAPHLTNAVTGRPMRLANGPGNFNYTTNATLTKYTVTGHLYGGSEVSQSEGL
jgi:hypothetical protein